MDNLPKGKQAVEKQGDGRRINRPGLYFHEKAGKWVEAIAPEQADAFVRLGYIPATDEHKKLIQTEREKLKKG